MIDRRSLTDPNLSGTDYVLEGASVRDRFLTAFILQHNEASTSVWPHAVRPADHPDSFDMSALMPAAGEESFSIQVESTFEPLTVQVIDQWFSANDDDEEM